MPSNLDAVLNQVLDEVSRGAHPWTLPAGVVKELRKRYTPGFDRALKIQNYWYLYGQKVLRMARCAGSCGAFFAETTGYPSASPGSVQLKHMLMAMGIVKIWCVSRKRVGSSGKAMDKAVKTLGKPCEGMNIKEGIEPLRAFLKETQDELPDHAASLKGSRRNKDRSAATPR